MKLRYPAVAVAAATASLIGAVYAVAGHEQNTVPSYTGCLSTGNGKVDKIAPGEAPASACSGNETPIHLGGGDVTAVQAGIGLLGGGPAGKVDLRYDPDVVQSRVTEACPKLRGEDSAIGEIHQDGAVTCNEDDGLTSVSQGFGLTGNGTGANPLEVSAVDVQKRVNTFSCESPGRSVKAIEQDGSVACNRGPRVTGGKKTGPSDLAEGFEVIGSLPLPTGKWLVIAKVLANSTKLDPANEVLATTCQLTAGSDVDRAIVWGDNDLAAGGTMTMMVWTDSAGFGPEAVVECRDAASATNINAHMEWRRLRIVAIQVDDILEAGLG